MYRMGWRTSWILIRLISGSGRNYLFQHFNLNNLADGAQGYETVERSHRRVHGDFKERTGATMPLLMCFVLHSYSLASRR